MANTTRFLIEIPDVGADADAWGAIINNYLNGLEALVTDKRGDTLTGALTATSFSGVGSGLTALNAGNITTGTLANARTTATNENTASAIVSRDASGNFSAGTITASLNGNASTATSAANGGVTSVNAGTGISVNQTTGGVTVTNAAPNNPDLKVAYAFVETANALGTTVASRNVSSVSRAITNSAPTYTINFTNAVSGVLLPFGSTTGVNGAGAANDDANYQVTFSGSIGNGTFNTTSATVTFVIHASNVFRHASNINRLGRVAFYVI